MSIHVKQFKSKSTPGKWYTARLDDAFGTGSCDCPAWVYKKKGILTRRCAHLDALAKEHGIMAPGEKLGAAQGTKTGSVKIGVMSPWEKKADEAITSFKAAGAAALAVKIDQEAFAAGMKVLADLIEKEAKKTLPIMMVPPTLMQYQPKYQKQAKHAQPPKPPVPDQGPPLAKVKGKRRIEFDEED